MCLVFDLNHEIFIVIIAHKLDKNYNIIVPVIGPKQEVITPERNIKMTFQIPITVVSSAAKFVSGFYKHHETIMNSINYEVNCRHSKNHI